jgi:hypothetical protein
MKGNLVLSNRVCILLLLLLLHTFNNHTHTIGHEGWGTGSNRDGW